MEKIKKMFLRLGILSLVFVLVPVFSSAALVPCGNTANNPCTICHFFTMLANVYDFIVFKIANPLAILAILIGAIMMMISAGNPNRFTQGRQIIFFSIIGLVLVYCSWLIINVILTSLGFNMGSWFSPNLNCN